jgi:hypothetical protein
MSGIDSAMSPLDRARRRAALALFRLAASILRKGLELYKWRRVFRPSLRLVLSMTAVLERCAGLLLFGSKKHRVRPFRTISRSERPGEGGNPVREL